MFSFHSLGALLPRTVFSIEDGDMMRAPNFVKDDATFFLVSTMEHALHMWLWGIEHRVSPSVALELYKRTAKTPTP